MSGFRHTTSSNECVFQRANTATDTATGNPTKRDIALGGACSTSIIHQHGDLTGVELVGVEIRPHDFIGDHFLKIQIIQGLHPTLVTPCAVTGRQLIRRADDTG
ncbi:hypothetical protein D3C80_1175670 [compost metagenome]